jgi:hypothetical protein
MDAPLSHLSDSELQRLAYGRAVTPEEQERAAAAGEELARREKARAAEARAADARTAAMRSPDAPLDAPDEAERAIEADRPWWRRPIAVAAAGILVLVAGGAMQLAPQVLGLQDPAPPAFAIFDREPLPHERELRPALQSGGHLSPTGPRVLGEIGFGTVVAWLPRPAGTIRQTAYDGINPADGPAQVCLGVVEEDPVARVASVSEWRCVEVADFAEHGVSDTLSGAGGRYEVVWSPEGAVDLDVTITEAQRNTMDPGFRRIFLPGALGPVPSPQNTAALLFDQAGYIDASIRLITPMGEVVEGSTPPDELLIAFIGRSVGAVGAGSVGPAFACLAVVTDEDVRELGCTEEDALEAGGGLSLAVTRGIATFVVSWSSEGDIMLQGSTPR